jgi:membrane fusion protein, heavy metal efflux system
MTRNRTVTLRWSVVAVVAAALLAAGATYVALRSAASSGRTADDSRTSPPPAKSSATASANTSSTDVVVSISPDAMLRAGIVVTPVTTGSGATRLRLPGAVEPNAYRQVIVTSLVAGRVTEVLVALGDRVRRGQRMARVFSPELAEALTRYTSAGAALEAHERELQRTQKLVEIGAASRQELERIHAEHTAQTAEVQSARSRLELLGLPAAVLDRATQGRPDPSSSVPAPIDGVVTERTANVGSNVESGARLFTVVDLSTVWVVADLYEKDFSQVRVGSPATVTTTAYPDLALEGRVSYIDPRVSADTRTAKVRVEIANAQNQLRLGMFADVAVNGSGGGNATMIKRSAVQSVGDHQVVYLSKEPGQFIEREVRLGQPSGDRIEVLSGLQPGDAIVTESSFFVRAERERLGLRPGAGERPAGVQTARVVVGEQGYQPARVSLRAGTPARLTFVRTTDKTCGTEILVPSLKIRRALPLNEPVVIEFTPAQSGEIAFSCGMNMLHGTVVVQ